MFAFVIFRISFYQFRAFKLQTIKTGFCSLKFFELSNSFHFVLSATGVSLKSLFIPFFMLRFQFLIVLSVLLNIFIPAVYLRVFTSCYTPLIFTVSLSPPLHLNFESKSSAHFKSFQSNVKRLEVLASLLYFFLYTFFIFEKFFFWFYWSKVSSFDWFNINNSLYFSLVSISFLQFSNGKLFLLFVVYLEFLTCHFRLLFFFSLFTTFLFLFLGVSILFYILVIGVNFFIYSLWFLSWYE